MEGSGRDRDASGAREASLGGGWRRRLGGRRLLTLLLPESAPLDMRIFGRTLLHAALVGVAAGLVGAAFFAALEYLQRLLLEDLAGYVFLRARGEQFLHFPGGHTFRPWLLLVLPAAGALLGGLVVRFAPETEGGGGDAMIHAFHHHSGVVRARVAWVKSVASLLTLGTGGSGGREGPTMQIGSALGSSVGRLLQVSERERRVLFVAGVAAGMSAVFRTPLGAALLAIEVLYRDDFEAEALIPAILSSVIAYAIVISIFGESTLFAHSARYPFIPEHLPLYAMLALVIAFASALFAGMLRTVRHVALRLPVAAWARPALGGLGLGLLAVPAVVIVGNHIGRPGQGLGILGGGYGAAQSAITGAEWLRGGWHDVELLVALGAIKLLGSSLTIGSGGSAGDFAPSLVLGALFGGAFGRAAALVLGDPRIDPGAFALVGMGTFYGGIAHVPIASLILVSELAGSYDLLVPLMLAEGVALAALGRRSLYEAQLPTRMEGPAQQAAGIDALRGLRVADVAARHDFVSFALDTRAREIFERAAAAADQQSFPVTDGDGRLRGIIRAEVLRSLRTDGDIEDWMVAADLVQAFPAIGLDADLRSATEVMIANGTRDAPVVDAGGRVVRFLDEADVFKAYLEATARRSAPASDRPPPTDD
jgi:CIC family chloride channel protein